MSPRGHGVQVRRPFISTAELMELTGITRKTLRVYEDVGICTPHHVGGSYFKYWTLEQASDVALAQLLSSHGAPLAGIAASLEKSDPEIVSEAKAFTVSALRRLRRELKSIVYREQAIKRFDRIEEADKRYLMYLPERRLALIPCNPEFSSSETSDAYVEAYQRLVSVCEVVGWALTDLHGTVSEIGPGGKLRARWVCVPLASTPLPAPSGKQAIDCGCYRVFSGQGPLPACEDADCSACALYGREPTDAERGRLEHDQEAPAADETGEADRDGNDCGGDTTARVVEAAEWEKGSKGRALLMPWKTPLPYGVTACSIPAGWYLCEQADVGDEGFQAESFIDALRGFPTMPLRDYAQDGGSRARDMQNGEATEATDARVMTTSETLAPFPEPFSASPPSRAETRVEQGPLYLKGTRAPGTAAHGDEEEPALVTGAGFDGRPGFLVLGVRTPYGRMRKDIRKELEVLVRF